MTIANGVAKELRYKRETTWSVLPATNAAQFLRRVTSDARPAKQTYQSNEIRRDRQIADFRHGVRSRRGPHRRRALAGHLRRLLPRRAAPGVPDRADHRHHREPGGGLGAAAVRARRGQLRHRRLQDRRRDALDRRHGLRHGEQQPQLHDLGIAGGTGLSGFNLDGTDVVAAGTQTSMVGTLAGKKTWVPSTGQLDESFAFEHWFSDISQSERFAGCKLSRWASCCRPPASPPSAMQLHGPRPHHRHRRVLRHRLGQRRDHHRPRRRGERHHPGRHAAGRLGHRHDLSINENLAMEPVVGTNTYPTINQGRFVASGQLTAFFEDGTLRDLFDNETEVSIMARCRSTTPAPRLRSRSSLPRVKLGGAARTTARRASCRPALPGAAQHGRRHRGHHAAHHHEHPGQPGDVSRARPYTAGVRPDVCTPPRERRPWIR
jgi:hypothetical protein